MRHHGMTENGTQFRIDIGDIGVFLLHPHQVSGPWQVAIVVNAGFTGRHHAHHVLHAGVVNDEIDIREILGGLHDVVHVEIGFKAARQRQSFVNTYISDAKFK